MSGPVTITVVTATFNAARTLGDLSDDLRRQTDAAFQWIVIDGGSTDGTLACIAPELASRTRVIQEPDHGIYDAINKGVRRCETTHYLVIGADDRLDPQAIAQFRQLAQESDADIVAASVREAGRIARSNRGKPWLRGQNAYISHHSVGTLFRTSLHERFGLYTKRLTLAADQLFVKNAISAGVRVRYCPDVVVGEFSREGQSSTRYLACLFEFTLVQLQTEPHRGFQLLLLIGRLIRHWSKALK